MSKQRVIYILNHFPQISQTYVKSEIEAIRDEYDVLVIGLAEPDLHYKNHAPYRILPDWDEILETIEEFRPHVLHTHFLHNIWKMEYFAKRTGIPYTVRAHSYDILTDPENHYPSAVPLINEDLCLGVLTFPFVRPALEKIGVRSDKLYDCFPVINYKRFYDRSPNGQAVMNVGACTPKKKMEDFFQLATQIPHMEFNLYALGYKVAKLIRLNDQMGNPVNIIPPIEPEDMPSEYKKHRWLIYTASREIGTVGWSMAIAEAQASGVGVCMANLRPDLREYVGEGGFLFNSMSEARDIVSKPFPEELREMGFEQAKKADIFEHKVILTNLWRKAHRSDSQISREPNFRERFLAECAECALGYASHDAKLGVVRWFRRGIYHLFLKACLVMGIYPRSVINFLLDPRRGAKINFFRRNRGLEALKRGGEEQK